MTSNTLPNYHLTYETNNYLDESSQTNSKLFMSFGEMKDGILVNNTIWFRCKDFFTDYILSSLLAKEGFDWWCMGGNDDDVGEQFVYGLDFSGYDTDLEKVKILFWSNDLNEPFDNPKFKLDLTKEILEEFEDTFGYSSSIQILNEKTLIVDFDKGWIKNHFLFSFFIGWLRYFVLLGQGYYTPSEFILERYLYPEKESILLYDSRNQKYINPLKNPNIISFISNLKYVDSVEYISELVREKLVYDNMDIHDNGFRAYAKRYL